MAKREPEELPWVKLIERVDLEEGIVEIFRDCSHAGKLHEFTRGTIKSIQWKGGRISRIDIKLATKCYSTEECPQKWESSNTRYIECDQKGWQELDDSDSPFRANAWICGDVVTFRTLDDHSVAIFPRGITAPEKPFFYEPEEKEPKTPVRRKK